MHPSLDLKNLQKLPAQLKTQALAAARGSFTDISSLRLALPGTPTRSLPLLIPAFYANLDTQPLEELETCGVASLCERISCVSASVDALSSLVERGVVPAAALDELWERGWRWAEFLHSTVRTGGSGSQLEFYAHFITFFHGNMFHGVHGGARARKHSMATACPGFFHFIGFAWRHLFQIKSSAQSLVGSIVTFASDAGEYQETRRIDDEALFEAIDGLGGTWDALASILVQTLHLVVADGIIPIPILCLSHILGAMYLLHDAGGHRPELCILLLDHGVVAALVLACRALMKSEFARSLLSFPSLSMKSGNPLYDVTFLISAYLGLPRRQERVVEALRAGLLFAYFDGPEDVYDDKIISQNMWSILYYHIRSSTMFHSVVAELEIALHKVINLDPLKQFRQLSEDFSPKDRAFFKALMHHEYLRKQDDVSLNFMARIHDEPSCIPLTTFTFDSAGGTIVTTSDMYYDKVTAGLAAEIRRFGDQRARRDWRVDMHVMELPSRTARAFPEPQTEGSRYILNPMRSTDTELHDKLCSMAKIIPPARVGERGVLDPYREDVQKLVQSHAEVRRIH
ncbi:hypothetical protein C8F01DRAFT_1376719 [Mycena amicta]|nr:hypothetical protein C8F01DRAFT_1376719 [Mycena amicta]